MFPAWLIVPVSPSIAESPRLEDGYPAGGMASAAQSRGRRGTYRRVCRGGYPLIRGRADPRRFRIAAIGGRLGWFAPGRSGTQAPIPEGDDGAARLSGAPPTGRRGRNGPDARDGLRMPSIAPGALSDDRDPDERTRGPTPSRGGCHGR